MNHGNEMSALGLGGMAAIDGAIFISFVFSFFMRETKRGAGQFLLPCMLAPQIIASGLRY